MALQKWTCLKCGKDFEVGKWLCADGENHVVASKEYLLNDAPSDPGHPAAGGMDSKRDGQTHVCNIPPDKNVMVGGEVKIIPGGHVVFIRGRFSSTNPEVQYWLDKKGGWCSEEQWRQAWLSSDQQLEIDRMKLRADRQRLENERNELLAQVQKEKKTQARA